MRNDAQVEKDASRSGKGRLGRSCSCGGNDAESVDVSINSGILSILRGHSGLSRNTTSASECCIYRAAQEGCNEQNDPEDENSFSPEVEQLKTEELERDPLFISSKICKVNFTGGDTFP